MPTPEQVKKAFHDAIPARRDAFEQAVLALHWRLTHSDDQYPTHYPRDVLLLAEQEIRARNALAAERVKTLLDSGWTPPPTTSIRGVFIDMFSGYDHWKKDASKDLYDRIDASFDEVGRHAPAEQAANRQRLGEVQTQSAEACISDLEVYHVKKPQQSVTVHNTGNLGAVQVGQSNVAHVTQSQSSEIVYVKNVLSLVREHLPSLADADAKAELEGYVAAIESELEKPAPKPALLTTWLSGLKRVASTAAGWAGKAAVQNAVSAALQHIHH